MRRASPPIRAGRGRSVCTANRLLRLPGEWGPSSRSDNGDKTAGAAERMLGNTQG